jgi:DNA repair exonuclease SbcCD ATPase subunit
MNTISAERKRRAEETKAEIERLKAELAARDEEIARLHDETVVLDTDRVWDLEQEVAALKRELASRSGVQHVPSSPAYEWTRAARDPYSDDFMELDIEDDDQDFGEATRAELLCSTPSRRMVRASASFPTPPATSPEPQLPQTPCRRLPTPCSSVGVQASLPDPEKHQLEEKLESLQLEVNKLTATLEAYSALTSRLSDKLTPFSPRPRSAEPSAEKPDLEAHLTTVLQALSDRTAALAELDSSLKTLGFPGSDGFEVIDSLRSAFRSARLELEYITPGEITLPLTGAGAEVLDLVLTQLRDLAKKNRDADDSIDEYHAIELSLRQQLNARVTAMDNLANRLTTAERDSAQKDARIADLEVGLDRLKNAVRTYTRDISELEALVQRMETDLATSNLARDTATAALDDKISAISSLEEQLANAITQSNTLQSELSTLTTTHAQTLASHKEELASMTASHSTALAQRDARITELSAEVERVEALLREAQETVQKLRAENDQLAQANDTLKEENARGRRTAEEIVSGMRAELERVVRMSEGFLGALGAGTAAGKDREELTSNEGETTMSGAGGKAGRLIGTVGGSDRGRKRRKFDSGLGFLDEEEVGEAD